EAVRVTRAEREPRHEVGDGDAQTEPAGDECEVRARREAQTAAFEEFLHGSLMLSGPLGRRTLRRLGQSAARLAVVPAARLPERDAEPEIAARDDEPTRQRDVRLGEVTDGSAEAAAAVRMHVRTI